MQQGAAWLPHAAWLPVRQAAAALAAGPHCTRQPRYALCTMRREAYTLVKRGAAARAQYTTLTLTLTLILTLPNPDPNPNPDPDPNPNPNQARAQYTLRAEPGGELLLVAHEVSHEETLIFAPAAAPHGLPPPPSELPPRLTDASPYLLARLLSNFSGTQHRLYDSGVAPGSQPPLTLTLTLILTLTLTLTLNPNPNPNQAASRHYSSRSRNRSNRTRRSTWQQSRARRRRLWPRARRRLLLV